MPYFGENVIIISNSQPARLETRKINGGRRILVHKGLKTASCNVRNRLKFGKISRKDLLGTKMLKNGYREFHHSGTLKCFYDEILDTHFFTFSYTISLSQKSCQISIYNEHENLRILDFYFREFTAAKLFVILYAYCRTNCHYKFNQRGIFEKMTSFSPILNHDLEQGKLIFFFFF